VDVGKTSVALSVTDAERRRQLGPVEFAMTKSALATTLGQIRAVLPDGWVFVKVGVEACGHYHRPLLTPVGVAVGLRVRWS
jgi:hypothetical protein